MIITVSSYKGHSMTNMSKQPHYYCCNFNLRKQKVGKNFLRQWCQKHIFLVATELCKHSRLIQLKTITILQLHSTQKTITQKQRKKRQEIKDEPRVLSTFFITLNFAYLTPPHWFLWKVWKMIEKLSNLKEFFLLMINTAVTRPFEMFWSNEVITDSMKTILDNKTKPNIG